MKVDCNISVHPLTRVEGHGNIDIRIKGGKVEEACWEVVETPRFFEAILVGKKWENAPYITGRICGICSIGHTLASIRAVENGFDDLLSYISTSASSTPFSTTVTRPRLKIDGSSPEEYRVLRQQCRQSKTGTLERRDLQRRIKRLRMKYKKASRTRTGGTWGKLISVETIPSAHDCGQ